MAKLKKSVIFDKENFEFVVNIASYLSKETHSLISFSETVNLIIEEVRRKIKNEEDLKKYADNLIDFIGVILD